MGDVAPVLHGREPALRALRGALEGALGGRGQLAVVSGEAGIGKSAIASAIAREAEARGAVVTWGRAWEFAEAPPYFPLWPCLRTLGIDVGAGPQSQEQHDQGHAFQLWETVVASLARASSSAPAVWLLEDLHAADLGTLDLLTFLAQPLRAMRVLVVATVRSHDPRLSDRMTQRLTRMTRDGVDVHLEPLSDVDVAALTEATIGRAVPESALRALVDLTGGNPLFVVECARAFRTAGGIEGTLGTLPPTVRQVALDRVALLPEATRHALACGAILGREFSAASVARMDRSLPARVVDSLLPALRSGLVGETRPGHFAFSHALVRDAIDDALGGEERATIHGLADAALAALGDTADVLVERARHALAALRSGAEAHALEIVDRATALLERDGAFDRAFQLHLRMNEARSAGLLSPAPPDKLLHSAHIARAAGRSDASRRLCEEVFAAARSAGDAELLARAALLHASDVRVGVVDRSQVALLEEARAALGDNAPELGCRLLARLATAMTPAPDPAEPMTMAREALRRAREIGGDATIASVLDLGVWAMFYASLPERVAWSEELLERALRANELPKALTAYSFLAFQRLETSDFDAFDRDVTSMLELSDEIGHPSHRWRALLLASGRAIMRGQFAESDRYFTEVAQLSALCDDPLLAFSLVHHEIMRAKLLRRDDEVRPATMKLEHAMPGVRNGHVYAAATRAVCWARMEDVEATRAELAIIGSHAPMLYEQPTLGAFMAEAYAVAGTDQERRRIREVLARGEGLEVIGGHVSLTYEGTLPRVLGLLDAALGDLVSAERLLREAHALAVARGHLPWVAQTAYELASVLGRAGRNDESRALKEESSRIAHELGMTGLERTSTNTGSPPSPSAPSVAMERTKAGWRVTGGDGVVTVKDSRGMQLLARLLERPDEEIHVLALASDEAAGLAETSAGEMLDDRARAAYRKRLADLDEDLAEAERLANGRRVEKLQQEKAALLAELARAVSLGGRVRQAGSATERARVNVQKRLKDAIARIAEVDEGLGRFLQRTVRSGTFCCFRLK